MYNLGLNCFHVNLKFINNVIESIMVYMNMIITNRIKLCPLSSAVVSFRLASVCLHVHHRVHGLDKGGIERSRPPPPNENSFISLVKLPKIHFVSKCPHRHVNALTHFASLLGNIILGGNVIFILYCLLK